MKLLSREQMNNKEQLSNLLVLKLSTANCKITLLAQEQLLNYLLLLDKWNHTYNLTSVRDIEEMIPLHILDSLSIANYLHGQRIIDVGTGAGLPGIPLAITQPEREFVLLDSNGKKTRFLIHVLQQLNLTNVVVVQERVENYKPEKCFDSVVSRAFSNLNDFLQKTQHLCCADGQFLAMKGQYPHDELAVIGDNFKIIAIQALTIPELSAQRHLICLAKI